MRELFRMHMQGTMHAAPAAGAEPVIEFLTPTASASSSAVDIFASGYAGQQARAQQSELGRPATQQGTVRVPREAVAGLFQQGAFRDPLALGMSPHQADQRHMLQMSYARNPYTAPPGAMVPQQMYGSPAYARRR